MRGNAFVGDLMTTKVTHREMTGFVIDGLASDLTWFAGSRMTVHTKGITPIGPLHRGPGEIIYALSCGGRGQIRRRVIADANAVVVVRLRWRFANGSGCSNRN